MRRPTPTPRQLAGWLLPVLLPPLVGAALFFASGTHQLVPGFGGCRWVREVGAQLRCYGAEARQIARSDGAPAAIRAVDRRARSDRSLRDECHLVLHRIGEPDGRRAGRRGTGIPERLPPDSLCHDGYVHGFFIGYMEASPGDAGTAREVGSYCAREGRRRQVVNCAHSWGHVMARRSTGHPAKLADACGGLHVSEPGSAAGSELEQAARFDCLYGGFMEYTLGDLAAKRDGPLDNCRDVDGTEPAKACYSFLPGRALMLGGQDVEQTVRACEHAKGDGPETCAASLGRDLGDEACAAFDDPDLRDRCEADASKL